MHSINVQLIFNYIKIFIIGENCFLPRTTPSKNFLFNLLKHSQEVTTIQFLPTFLYNVTRIQRRKCQRIYDFKIYVKVSNNLHPFSSCFRQYYSRHRRKQDNHSEIEWSPLFSKFVKPWRPQLTVQYSYPCEKLTLTMKNSVSNNN